MPPMIISALEDAIEFLGTALFSFALGVTIERKDMPASNTVDPIELRKLVLLLALKLDVFVSMRPDERVADEYKAECRDLILTATRAAE